VVVGKVPGYVLYGGPGALHPDDALVDVDVVRCGVEDPVVGQAGRGIGRHLAGDANFLVPERYVTILYSTL
jgi:hypothetical protein